LFSEKIKSRRLLDGRKCERMMKVVARLFVSLGIGASSCRYSNEEEKSFMQRSARK
jgi:hypothetical protein